MLMNQAEYFDTIAAIKHEIRNAQYRAAVSANRELLMLYYHIGQMINEHKVWGNKFIENLSADIRMEFPNSKGYSVRNLKYMAKFAAMFPDEEIVQEALAQITWYHNITLMDKVKDREIYLWYVSQAAKNGWSRDVMVHQIESDLYSRQVLADKVSNYDARLALPQSELAVQLLNYLLMESITRYYKETQEGVEYMCKIRRHAVNILRVPEFKPSLRRRLFHPASVNHNIFM